MTVVERCPYAPGALLERANPGDGTEALSAIAACSQRSCELYRLLGLFCHAAKNKLNSLHLCLYLMESEGRGWSDAIGHYQETMRVIEAIQTICRLPALDLAELPFGLLIDDRVTCWQEMLRRRRLNLEITRPRQAVWSAFDPSRMSRALDDLVRWRSGEAEPGGVIRLAWRTEEPWAVLDWAESGADGPKAVDPSSGALPLAVLARILTSMGGRTTVDPGPPFRMTMRWPARAPQ